MVMLLANKFVSDPNGGSAVRLEDTAETWATLLTNPEVVPDSPEGEDAKEASSALCGAVYFPSASNRDKENIEAVEWLVLDVDCPATPAGQAPPESTLRDSLSGLRAIVYSSPSHTAGKPRWRVLLPLLSPLPPKKYRSLVKWLSENLAGPEYAGCIDVESTGDPGRLGFVGVTKHPEHYTWWQQNGARFDWTPVPLEDEVWAKAPLGGLERSPLWLDRPSAMKAALKAYSTVGQGVGRGQGRTKMLWDAALNLWWAWAAEDEDFVLTVMRHVNTNFKEPEDEAELVRKMTEAHQRAIGERRVSQSNGTYGWKREPANVVSREAIQKHARRLRQRQNPELSLIGEALSRFAKGETLSDEPETWRGLVTKCAHELARAFPNEGADRITGYFRPALATMKAAGGVLPSEQEIQAIIETRLEGLRRQRAEQQDRTDAQVREQIEYITKGVRDTRYTKQEVSRWEQTVGLRQNNWILVVGRAYFVFLNGTWVGPYTREEFDAQGYKALAAAYDVGIRTKIFNEAKGTWTNIPLAQLLHDYGSQCTTKVDMNCDKAWFNVDEHELVLAGPVKRDIGARFHEEIDAWLRAMTGRKNPRNTKEAQAEAAVSIGLKDGGDSYDVLCDWLAGLTQLDRPCAALYLEGEHGVGKGLFANGIARIWKHGAIGLEHAMHEFNALLLETPIVWVDEELPPRMGASALLRKVLASREFVYTRKYKDSGKILGCVRIIFAANNLDLFNQAKEIVKKADIDALAQRFLHIDVRPESKAYLDSISPKHEDFVERNMLAEHALWLCEKRWSTIKNRGLRFLVKGKQTIVSDVVATNSPVTSDCCNEICAALVLAGESKAGVAGGGFGGAAAEWFTVRDGLVWVNVAALKKRFDLQMEQHKEREVARAISSISAASASQSLYNDKAKKTMRMWPVRPDALYAWCKNTNVFVWKDVRDAIEKLDKSSGGSNGGQDGDGTGTMLGGTGGMSAAGPSSGEMVN